MFCKKIIFFFSVAFSFPAFAASVSNPLIWSDVPDMSVVRGEGNNYYMVSTTMHLVPGVPIMHSSDLANWRTVGYAYQKLTDNDNMNLNGGLDAYGNGSWASSLRYHQGKYYVLTPGKTSGKTHLYVTENIEKGIWTEYQLPFYHDPSLFFDDDGSVFIIYGSGTIFYVELSADASRVKAGGRSGTLNLPIEAIVGKTGLAEGAHIEKINGFYYLFIITWPAGGRTEAVFRSSSMTGNYEGKIFLKDRGIAQGSIFDTPDGKWYGYLFKDNGGVGRIPYLMEVEWENNWPVVKGGKAPETLELENSVTPGYNMVTSDDFENTELPLEWQWNHNPDNSRWALSEGKLKITTGRVDEKLIDAKNTLTMRTFGPTCSGRTLVLGHGMKEGDRAGLVALADSLGFVALEKTAEGYKIVQYERTVRKAEALLASNQVYLRIDFDFSPSGFGFTDLAQFYYSMDGVSWTQIGNALKLPYTLGMFIGYRFGLFAFATKNAGGYAEFEWFKVGRNVDEAIYLEPFRTIADTTPQVPYQGMAASVPGRIEAENYDEGAQGQAYFDVSFQNEGKNYREDRVDIVKGGSGYAIGYTIEGEWLEYTVNVQKSGKYILTANVSSAVETSALQFFVDGNALSEPYTIPKTGDDWETYKTVKITEADLSEGKHIIRMSVAKSFVNVDWFSFDESFSVGIHKRKKKLLNSSTPDVHYFDMQGNRLNKETLMHRGVYIVRLPGGKSFVKRTEKLR